ncbi:MAG: hypothetical protein AAB646_00505 [Patescibacteria group bacterium]
MKRNLYLFLILTILGVGGGLLVRGFTSSSESYRINGIIVPPETRPSENPIIQRTYPTVEISTGSPKDAAVLTISSVVGNFPDWELFGVTAVLGIFIYLLYRLSSLKQQLVKETHKREALETELTIHKTFDQLKNTVQKGSLQQVLDEFSLVEESLRKTVSDLLVR